MKCPHCGYEDGFNGEFMTTINGEHGEFYKLPIELRRQRPFCSDEVANVYGCPACNVVFMDKW